MKRCLIVVIALVLCASSGCGNYGKNDLPQAMTTPSGMASAPTKPPQPVLHEESLQSSDRADPAATGNEAPSPFSSVIMRKEQTIYSREEHLNCSSMYYEIPVILAYSDFLGQYVSVDDTNMAAKKINTYFEQEAKTFFERGAEFTAQSQDLAGRYQDGLGQYHNEMKSIVTQCDPSLFSVHQMLYYCTTGLNSCTDYGVTFSMETGEKLDLSYFVRMDHDAFSETVFDFLNENLGDDWRKDMAIDYYRSLFSSFEDYSFFYQDESVYITFPPLSNESSRIVRWSTIDDAPIEFLYGTTTDS